MEKKTTFFSQRWRCSLLSTCLITAQQILLIWLTYRWIIPCTVRDYRDYQWSTRRERGLSWQIFSLSLFTFSFSCYTCRQAIYTRVLLHCQQYFWRTLVPRDDTFYPEGQSFLFSFIFCSSDQGRGRTDIKLSSCQFYSKCDATWEVKGHIFWFLLLSGV